MDIRVPLDRDGRYGPKIISKYGRNTDGIEEKIPTL